MQWGKALQRILDFDRSGVRLQRSESMLEAMLTASINAIITVDAEDVIVEWNAAATGIFGYTREHAIGRRMNDLIIPEASREAHRRGLALYLETGVHRILNRRIEVTAMGISGNTFPVELAITPLVLDGKTYFTAAVYDITDRVQAEQHRTLLINELDHRVKNTLAITQSIAAQTLRSDKTREEAHADFVSRLQTLGATHAVLTREGWKRANVADLVQAVRTTYGMIDASRFEINGSDFEVPAAVAVSLSMALHELGTNAIKYGSLSVPGGYVSVTWAALASQHEPQFRLSWQEHEGPPVTEPTRQGFGTRMIRRAFAQIEGSSTELTFGVTGLRCSIKVPLAAIVEAPVPPTVEPVSR